jgi:hypothetical protein
MDEISKTNPGASAGFAFFYWSLFVPAYGAIILAGAATRWSRSG